MTNLPKIALGAWAWGNDGTFGGDITAESLRPIFDTAMANGLNLYGLRLRHGNLREGAGRVPEGA